MRIGAQASAIVVYFLIKRYFLVIFHGKKVYVFFIGKTTLQKKSSDLEFSGIQKNPTFQKKPTSGVFFESPTRILRVGITLFRAMLVTVG